MFILDDATPFGVSEASVRKFTEMMSIQPTVLNARGLARELRKLIPGDSKIVSIGFGGALTYTLLSQEGAAFPYIPLNAERQYTYQDGEKRPRIKIKVSSVGEPNIGEMLYDDEGRPLGTYRTSKPEKIILLDDVVASAQTVQTCRAYLRISKLRGVSTLILSGDTRGQFRTSDDSTILCVDSTYAAQVVDGAGGFPAILSLRFALLKTEEDQNFLYLAKYFDESRRSALKDFLRNGVEASGLKLLYKDDIEFIRRNGGQYAKDEMERWTTYEREFKSG